MRLRTWPRRGPRLSPVHDPHDLDRAASVVRFPEAGRDCYCYDPSARRVICTFAVGAHRQLGAISIEAARRYGERWKWDVVASCEPQLACGRPASWAKVPLVLELMQTYEWVWLIDADALIVDLEQDIFEGIDCNDGPIWLARHRQGGHPDHVVENAGVMLVHATHAARQFLNDVWAATQFIDHNWWENAAILHLIGRNLEPPYSRGFETGYTSLVSTLALHWNVVPGYIDCVDAALHHHARADHDDFGLRLAAMRADLARTAPCEGREPVTQVG